MNVRIVFTLILAAICSQQTLMAQMPTPGQAVSVTVSVSGDPNSDYKLKDADGIALGESSVTDDMRAIVSVNIPLFRKGRELSLGIMPYYHFSGMRLKEDFGLNFGADHHRYGAIVMGTASTRLFGSPFSVMGMINADGWEQGYGQTQFICAGVWALIRNERTYLGLGPVVLLGTSSQSPVYLAFMYLHRFNPKWSANVTMAQNYITYQPSKTTKLSGGMEIDCERFYFHPDRNDLPYSSVLSHCTWKSGLFLDHQLHQHVSLSTAIGYDLPMRDKVIEKNHHTTLMNLSRRPTPFARVKVSCRM